MRRVLLAAAALGLSLGLARAGNEGTCFSDEVTREPAASRPGVVTARAYLYKGREVGPDCPKAGEACRTRTALFPGERVIVAPDTMPGFVCVAQVNRRRPARIGWVAAEAVSVQMLRPVKLSDWVGRWVPYRPSLLITRGIFVTRGKQAGTLRFVAEAKLKVLSGYRDGAFTGEIAPSGNSVAFADDGETVSYEQGSPHACAVKLALVDRLLVVSENGKCGGQGLNFSGFYRPVH